MSVPAIPSPFAVLAAECELVDEVGESPEGLAERYLYSTDKKYRYAFARWWGAAEDPSATAVWVLLNPATGDTENRRRPTLDRCITWSHQLGASGVVIVNLFALRATDPAALKASADPVGPHNDLSLEVFTATGQIIVAAWGGSGRLLGRSRAVRRHLHAPMCLGTTGRGEPRHPLYVKGNVELVPLP